MGINAGSIILTNRLLLLWLSTSFCFLNCTEWASALTVEELDNYMNAQICKQSIGIVAQPDLNTFCGNIPAGPRWHQCYKEYRSKLNIVLRWNVWVQTCRK